MIRTLKVVEIPDFDVAEYLGSDEDIAAYLTTVLHENDQLLLAAALRDIAQARGISQIAKDAGVERQALCKALHSGNEISFDNLGRVCTALGVRLADIPPPAIST